MGLHLLRGWFSLRVLFAFLAVVAILLSLTAVRNEVWIRTSRDGTADKHVMQILRSQQINHVRTFPWSDGFDVCMSATDFDRCRDELIEDAQDHRSGLTIIRSYGSLRLFRNKHRVSPSPASR